MVGNYRGRGERLRLGQIDESRTTPVTSRESLSSWVGEKMARTPFSWRSMLRLTPETNQFLRLSDADQKKLGATAAIFFILAAAFLLAWPGCFSLLRRR
jgi:hypothetical protein